MLPIYPSRQGRWTRRNNPSRNRISANVLRLSRVAAQRVAKASSSSTYFSLIIAHNNKLFSTGYAVASGHCPQ